MPETTTRMDGAFWKRTAASVPATAPAIPDARRGQKSRLSTLPSLTWLMPEASVVTISAM